MIQSIKRELHTAFTYQKKGYSNKTEIFKFKARQVHGDRYDYSKSIYKGTHTKLKVICHHHGSFYVTPASHITQKANCPYCANYRFTPELFLRIANRIHASLYKYHDINLIQYRGAMDIIKIECPEHGIFYQRLDLHLSGNGCPQCSRKPYNHDAKVKYKAQSLSIMGDR